MWKNTELILPLKRIDRAGAFALTAASYCTYAHGDRVDEVVARANTAEQALQEAIDNS
jgi:hypothetical protein